MSDIYENWPEIRCKRPYKGKVCNKVLARGHLKSGEVELECPRCGKYTILRASRPNLAPHDGLHGDRHERATSSSHQ